MNGSTAILLLSETKCDIDTNPNPKVRWLVLPNCSSPCFANGVTWFPSPVPVWGRLWDLPHNHAAARLNLRRVLHHQALDGHHVSEQVRSAQLHAERFCEWVSLNVCLWSSHMPADLNNVVLGSQQDGEYIKLPSFSALKSQIRGQNRITAQVRLCMTTSVRWHPFTCPAQTVNTTLSSQMSTFSTNPHPSNDSISGTVCSLVLSEGNVEIKLTNLTEMIEVNPVCLVPDAKVCVSVWLRCFFPVDLYAARQRRPRHT